MKYNYGAGLFLATLITIFFLAPIVFVLVAIGVLIYAAFKSDTTPEQHQPSTPRQSQRPSAADSTAKPIRGNRLMSATERTAYLLSPQWKALRKLVIARDKCCQLTGDITDLEVHHITYDNLSNEYLEDLVLLSRKAHQFVHNYYGSYDRNNTYPITKELKTAYTLSLLNNTYH